METKGVASVRSPVCNLKQVKPNIESEDVLDAIVHTFKRDYGVTDKVSL